MREFYQANVGKTLGIGRQHPAWQRMASIAASRDEIRDGIGKLMDLREEVRKLLQKIGPGQMMNTAYDTAWIARLGEIGEPIGELALEWLRENQLPDGSWGAEEPLYYHDRVICTLAAMNALARRGRVQDRKRTAQSRGSIKSIHRKTRR